LQETYSDGVQPSENRPTSDAATTTTAAAAVAATAVAGPKRLHFSNLPFRLREADLRALLTVIVLR